MGSGKIIAIIGGDIRMAHAAESLSQKHQTSLFAGKDFSGTLPKALYEADIVLLPFPYSDATEEFLHTPLYDGKIPVHCLFAAAAEGSHILGGRFGDKAKKLAAERNITLHDYQNDPEILSVGTVASAEGAVAMAMTACPDTIAGERCVVLGNGRCGSAIAARLSAWDAEVTVISRGAVPGQRHCSFNDEAGVFLALSEANIVFNTVPSPVLTAERLSKMKPGALVIDIASNPGGTDFAAAAELGITAALAPGIPGKYAPRAAGRVLADCVQKFIETTKNKGV